MHKVDEWQGAYPSNWKGLIVPEAMSHPAKYSSRLIRRIYEHMFQEGWVKPGDHVIDPFGGVALGALDAMRMGLNWYGNELEEKFFNLGNQNIELWDGKFSLLPHWGTAHLFHGDSRHLLEVIGARAEATVSSPPYGEEMSPHRAGNAADVIPSIGRGGAIQPRVYGDTEGQLGAMKAEGFEAAISSPPFLQSEGGTPEPKPGGTIDAALYARHAAGNKSADGYGTTDGQLSSMKDGGFEVAVSSPPYNPPMSQEHNGSRGGTRGTTPSEPGAFVKYGNTEGQLEGMNMDGFSAAISSPPFTGAQQVDNRTKPSSAMSNTWQKRFGVITDGVTDGQLANLPTGDFAAALSSPPYAQARIGQESGQGQCGHGDQYGETEGQLGAMEAEGFEAAVSSPPYDESDQNYKEGWKRFHDHHDPLWKNDIQREAEYGVSDGQLSQSDDFWLAARAIVEQVYAALVPGGHACWVVKDYVKNKQIVPFCDQWRQLCEAVGFVTLHEHHAMLIHKKGAQHTLEGGLVEKQTESKSFFRRLAEKKGSPRIDWETVLCMEKPLCTTTTNP